VEPLSIPRCSYKSSRMNLDNCSFIFLSESLAKRLSDSEWSNRYKNTFPRWRIALYTLLENSYTKWENKPTHCKSTNKLRISNSSFDHEPPSFFTPGY